MTLIVLVVVFILSLFNGVLSQNTLRGLVESKKLHLFVGSAANAGYLSSGQNLYNDTLAAQYNLVTAENECKFGPTEPNRGQFDFTQCDVVFSFARSHGQTFRGHNLCWGENNPGWLTNGGFSGAEKKSILANHITTVVKRYGNSVLGWDVVNEAVSDSGNEVLKNNTWYPDVPDYIDFAFQTARAANPTIKLFYNDYNIASSTGWSSQKSDKVYEMVKSMKQRGIPIDGVGLQLHVDLNYGSMVSGVIQNLQRLAALGLEIHMTEIDIACATSGQSCSSWDATKEQQQQAVYVALLKACLSEPKCTNFETWGFTDKYTWLPGQHPLPYDENYKPKPAYNGLLSTLKSA